VRSCRCTPDGHRAVRPHSAECSVSTSGCPATTAGRADEAQITASIALSHPGIPSRSNRARPTPRGPPTVSGRGTSHRAAMNCERSSSYCAVYRPGSTAATASAITGVFFPAASDTAGAAAGCCGGGHGCCSVRPRSQRAPRRSAYVRPRAPPGQVWPAPPR
jgi:hypothetical protein